MTKTDAGRLGGKATLKKYGRAHFSQIGKRGARVFHFRYRLVPTGTSDFAILCRTTSQIIGYLSGAHPLAQDRRQETDR